MIDLRHDFHKNIRVFRKRLAIRAVNVERDDVIALPNEMRLTKAGELARIVSGV